MGNLNTRTPANATSLQAEIETLPDTPDPAAVEAAIASFAPALAALRWDKPGSCDMLGKKLARKLGITVEPIRATVQRILAANEQAARDDGALDLRAEWARLYCYVDTAVGGEEHRNHPMRVDQFRPPANAPGVYQTWIHYDQGLHEHYKTHRNERGHRTVKSYRGAGWATILPYDVDRGDLVLAWRDTRRLVDWLMTEWDIPAEALRIVFSGSKGYHVEIDAEVFGGFEPCADIDKRTKLLARALVDGLGMDIDETVYEHLRLWRVENSIHQKNGHYAVPLTVNELMALDAETIAAIARAPRSVAHPPSGELLARPRLVELWQATAAGTCVERGEPTDRAVPLMGKIEAGSGRRHRALVSWAGTARRRGLDGDVLFAVVDSFNQAVCDPPAPADDVRAITDSISQYAVDDVPSDRLLFKTLADPNDATHTELEAERARRVKAEEEAAMLRKRLDLIEKAAANPQVRDVLLDYILLSRHAQTATALGTVAPDGWMKVTAEEGRNLTGLCEKTFSDHTDKLASCLVIRKRLVRDTGVTLEARGEDGDTYEFSPKVTQYHVGDLMEGLKRLSIVNPPDSKRRGKPIGLPKRPPTESADPSTDAVTVGRCPKHPDEIPVLVAACPRCMDAINNQVIEPDGNVYPPIRVGEVDGKDFPQDCSNGRLEASETVASLQAYLADHRDAPTTCPGCGRVRIWTPEQGLRCSVCDSIATPACPDCGGSTHTTSSTAPGLVLLLCEDDQCCRWGAAMSESAYRELVAGVKASAP